MLYYILFDFIKNQKYYFLGFIDLPILNLVNKLSNNTIDASELDILKKNYTEELTLDSIVFNFDVDNYNIYDLKKLLFVLLDIPVEKLHLWIINNNIETWKKFSIINRNKIDKDYVEIDFNNFPEILGYEYKNIEKGMKYYNPDILSLKNITIDFSDILEYTGNKIVNNYKNIKIIQYILSIMMIF